MRVIPSSRRRCAAPGFTLIELLVTLAIVAIGLLGVAKLQAAAMAETGVARTRSLMTFQAEALAAAMRANEAFWQSSAAYSQTVAIAAGGAITPNPSMSVIALNGCVGVTTCSPVNQAYDDLNNWATAFGQSFPAATGAIACAGTATTPVSCDITLTWSDKLVAVNRTTATGAALTPQTSNMILHIQP